MKNPKAVDIAYVRFSAPDLGLMQTFLEDFGLLVSKTDGRILYSRGTDADPYLHVVEQGPEQFLGLGFQMESMVDLEALAKRDGAAGIEDIDAPGDGKRVRFTSPSGWQIDGVYGIAPDMAIAQKPRVPINDGVNRNRLREPVRLSTRPSEVKRLGHCVLRVSDLRANELWYKERFGLITSDEIYAGEESNGIGMFMRCDRGDIPVDHHSLFLLGIGVDEFDHVAFEVNDWDDVMLGHDHLAEKNYEHHWGVGKHILGSQVFDYWNDPYGRTHEHFTDGDLFDAHRPPGLEPIDVLLGVQWGDKPDVN